MLKIDSFDTRVVGVIGIEAILDEVDCEEWYDHGDDHPCHVYMSV
jgi:hypothetical protein